MVAIPALEMIAVMVRGKSVTSAAQLCECFFLCESWKKQGSIPGGSYGFRSIMVRMNRRIILILFITSIILSVLCYFSKTKTEHQTVQTSSFSHQSHAWSGASRPEKQKSERQYSRKKLLRNVWRSTTHGDYSTDESKANFVKEMMLHAWNNYKRFAWGKNELAPLSRTAHNQGIFGNEDGSGLAATIVDALDTLWIMGLKKQYVEGRNYVRDNFDIRKVNSSVSVFEVNIRFLGGLLAAHSLTNESFYIEKAEQVGAALLQAFSRHQTPLPYPSVVPSTGDGFGVGQVVLSEVGSLHLEFLHLSYLTGNGAYLQKVKAIRNHLDHIHKMDGLYGNSVLDESFGWASRQASLGAQGDSFYEYLLKSYVQTDRKDVQAWKMYKEAVKAIERKMLQISEGGLTYIATWNNDVLEHTMSHLACFCVGMLALQAKYEVNVRKKQRAMKLAEDIGHTCHESYVRTASGIGPEDFYFNDKDTEATTTLGGKNYILRPEVIEGFFYLWRLTKKEKYKEWVWNATLAVNKYCRVANGFSGLHDVYDPVRGGHDDVQQSFFLAETLKYMYLTFKDDSVLSLDDWVFNTEAHPLPILKRYSKWPFSITS